MDVVAIISPYRGSCPEHQAYNLAYAKAAARDSFDRGEAPVAIHLVLGDANEVENPELRSQALEASATILHRVDRLAIYIDLGYSEGMIFEIEQAGLGIKPVEWRRIEGWPDYIQYSTQ